MDVSKVPSMDERDSPSLVERCRKLGLRITGPRKVILQVLDRSDDHPDVEELHRRVNAIQPKTNIATVYRTMSMLEQHGLIDRHSFADGRARYEVTRQDHHDHFINLETGEVVEFRSDEIENLQKAIAKKYGFEIVSHRLDIYVKAMK